MYLPNPSTQTGCDTRSILKKSLIDFYLAFLSPRPVAIAQLITIYL